MIEPIDDSHELIEIRNFLVVHSARLQLCKITSIIGAQASGKSVIAKVGYFGREYVSGYVTAVLGEDFSLRQFKKDKLDEFMNLFGGLSGFEGAFSVTYEIDDLAVTVSRISKSGRPKISQSKPLGSLGAKLKRTYNKFLQNSDTKKGMRYSMSVYSFYNNCEDVSEFWKSVPQVLFVPASRSFYATVSEELFSFLASSERVDPLTAQFGSFYEYAKRRLGGDSIFGRLSKEKTEQLKTVTKPILDGRFVRLKNSDYIQTSWGQVPLSSASSGQQEALPLLLSLMEFPDSNLNQLLIIEEPEAHLFPRAQKYILDLIVRIAHEERCNVLFTTHSPYVLACLNNHIVHSEKENDNLTYGAFLTDKGDVRAIIDDDRLIDTNFLDSISEEIANEFVDAFK